MIVFLLLSVVLSPAEKRGREIYLTGGSATALVAGATELPAASLPCASCHGFDRRGVAEGTVVPPDIRWSALSSLWYNDTSLRRAITSGISSRGNALSPVMPRYRMSPEALSDLIAFLSRDAPDPGLTDTTITIATSPMTRPIVAAYIADLNAAGGIYGRTLQLSSDGDSPFAYVCASPVSLDPLDRTPIITPFATTPSPTSFALYADLPTLALALSRSITPTRNVFIEHDGSAAALAAAAVLTPRNTFPRSDDDVLFLLGDVDVPVHDGWNPRILAAGLRRPLPPGRRITYAVPTIPADLTASSRSALTAFASRHALPPDQTATQLATYATMHVFVEALKRCGRELTREKLITALEQLYDFPTGLTPPITFNRNRRIGSPGAWVIEVDGRKARYVRAD